MRINVAEMFCSLNSKPVKRKVFRFCWILFPLFLKSQDSLPVAHTNFFSSAYESFVQQAAFENKPYIIFFTAPWCAPCHRLKNEIFSLPKIADLLNENYLVYSLDLDNITDAEINKRLFSVSQLPTILFFDPKGHSTDKATGYFDGYYFFKKIRMHIPPSKRGKDWAQE